MDGSVPRIAELLEGAVRPARRWGLNKPRPAQQRQHQPNNGPNELLPTEAYAATSEMQLIGEDGADREQNPHDQHEGGQDADSGRRCGLRSHGITCATPEAGSAPTS